MAEKAARVLVNPVFADLLLSHAAHRKRRCWGNTCRAYYQSMARKVHRSDGISLLATRPC